MKTKLLKHFSLRATMLVAMVCAAVTGAWAEEVTLTAGTNGSSCTVNNKEGIKVGTSSKGGDMTITVPANTTTLHLHAAAWKGVTGLSLNISGATASPSSISLTADDGISNNSPFTLNGTESDFEFSIKLSDITEETDITIASSSAKRFVIWDASADVSTGGNSDLEASDLALTNAPVALEFDLYNNTDAKVISYTTSSTGAVTVSSSEFISTEVNETTKTITVTPQKKTTSAETITINQAADETYAAGSTSFTVTIDDSTPFNGGDITFDATENTGTSPLSVSEVTLTCNSGALDNGSEYRLYKNSETTISLSNKATEAGYVIKSIAFTGVSSNPASGFGTQTGWTTEGNNGTWTGSATSVSFTASGAQVRATKIVVTVGQPAALSSIALSGTYSTVFHVGDEFSSDGIVVTATYDDASTKDVTSEASFSAPDMTSAGSKEVTVTYTENQVTKTATYDITVNEPATLTSIALSGNQPTEFEQGDEFSSDGIVVTANFDDETSSDVTTEATFSGYDLSVAGEQTVTVSYTYNGVTKTATYDITVALQKGTEDNPYTVAEVIEGKASGKSGIYVMGYIVGSFNATAPVKSGDSLVDTNFALADNAGETDGSKTIPVELTSASGFRDSWGPKTNTFNIDLAKVLLVGNGQTYFSKNAIKGSSEITKIAEAIKVTSAGYATWASDSPLDFDGKTIKAYIAKANGTTGVKFEQVTKVPANTGVLLIKEGGATEDIPVLSGAAGEVTGNVFVKGEGAAVASEDGNLHNYILNNVGGVLGFYRAAGQTVAANKAYIQIDESAGVKGFIALPGFDDETAISEITNAKALNGKWYNLAGQRVNHAQKGIFIVNGKKVVVK